MRKITDDDLTLLYYGEHDDPAIAARVAGSKTLSARYDALCEELRLADAYVPPERGDDYGAEVWQEISPQLDSRPASAGAGLGNWLSRLAQPRFSLAGALAMLVVAVLAFTLGRNGVQDAANMPADSVSTAAATEIGIDPARLLTASVSSHLEQVNMVLTQFVNSTEPDTSQAGQATDMLVANRLYRKAAVARGDHKLAAFLADLEPLLIEMAYQAQSGSQATRERMQKEVREGLLFRVRAMNTLLNKPEISV